MKRIFGIIPVLALIGGAASAQEGGLNRRVEVTKAYTAEVGSAEKLAAQPRMEDTVALRPEISYSIRPAAWQTTFGVKPIAAAMVDANFNRLQPVFYVKAGAGGPLQSVADAYLHLKKDRGVLGAYLNHYGQYSDIDDEQGQAMDATWSTNRVGVYGSLDAGSRLKLQGALDYDWNYFTRYGLAVSERSPWISPGEATVAGYSSPRARVAFGNDFSDLSYLNFRLGAEGGYFTDRKDNSQSDFSLFADLGKRFGMHTALLGVRYDGYYGGGEMSDYKDQVITFSPLYSLEMQRIKFSLGFDFTVDDMPGKSDLCFFPKFNLAWDVAGGHFVPFVTVDGGLANNGFRNLALRNPYMMGGAASTKNTARYDGHGGISGSFSSAFAYKVFAGASIYRSRASFIYVYADNATGSFIPGAQDVTQLTLGGDISGRIPGGFEALLAVRVHAYPDNTSTEKIAELPNMEIGLTARYNYRNRLVLEAGVNVLGTRYFYGCTEPVLSEPPFPDAKASPAADLHLSVDYKFRKRWGLFLEGRNLLNQQLYPYNHYRGLGVNVLGGVKLTF